MCNDGCSMGSMVYTNWYVSLVMLKLAETSNLVQLLGNLGLYCLTCLCGHFTHIFIVYPLLYWWKCGGMGFRWMDIF